MTLGVRFFGFFTSKNMPPYGACGGCKNFFDISKSLSNKPSLPRYRVQSPQSTWLLLQNDDFWKSWLDGKRLWVSDFLDFLLPKTCPHMGHVTGVKFFLISQSRLDIRSLHYQSLRWYMWVTSVVCKSQNNDFWKSSLGLKPLRGEFFWIFHFRKYPPFILNWRVEFFFDTPRLRMWYQWCDHHLKSSMWIVIWSWKRYWIVFHLSWPPTTLTQTPLL